MYRSRLKVKTLILLCMTGVLMILALRRDPDRKGETGEELLISEEEGGEETGEAVGQEKIWTSPGRNAKIRVLLLDQGGSIYHKEKDAGEGYPGELDYYEEPQGWVIVNEVPLEEYLRFVVPSEMPASYTLEALKAQAVVLRTSLCRELAENEEKTATEKYLTHAEMKRKWGAANFDTYLKKYTKAVEDTEGTVVWYNEACAWTPYHQSSNGETRNASEVLGTEDYPYICKRECPLDKAAEDEIQVTVFDYQEIQQLCRDFLVAEENSESAEKGYNFADFEILEMDSSGYVRQMRMGDTVCTGDQFRDALSLSSSAFSFYESIKGLKITTIGKGHGLGMSQWTANEMAKEKKNYEEILQFFFEGTTLNKEFDEKEATEN